MIMATGLVEPISRIISAMTNPMPCPAGAMIIQSVNNKRAAMIISIAAETAANMTITEAVITITLTVETIVSGFLISTIFPLMPAMYP
jgi:hypothetical protein